MSNIKCYISQYTELTGLELSSEAEERCDILNWKNMKILAVIEPINCLQTDKLNIFW